MLGMGAGVQYRRDPRNSSFEDSGVLSFTLFFPLGALPGRVVICPIPTPEPHSWGSGSAVPEQRRPQGTVSLVTAQSIASGAWGAAQKGFGSAKPKAYANRDVGVQTSEIKAGPMLVPSRCVCWLGVPVSCSQAGEMFSWWERERALGLCLGEFFLAEPACSVCYKFGELFSCSPVFALGHTQMC